MATAEIKGAHSLPTTRKTLVLKLNEVLVGVSGRNTESPVKYDSKLRYAQRLIRRVNTTEQGAIGQKKRSNTGEIKVSGLSHKQAKQGCPRLSWIMFHKICGMQRCIQKSEASHNHKNQNISIQDAASQIPCNLLLTKIPKHFINTKTTSLKFLDLCSAPGGKASQLLDNDLDIVCVDKNESRSKRFDENMKRLNFKASIYIANAENYDPGFKPDIVLIDAPCSATGTIRRNPDIFIKPAPKNLDDLIKIQDNILKNASKILNKNGIIMYITCSLQKIEGERRIEKFLIEQSNFSIIPFYPNEYPLIESCITKEGFLRILPNNLNFGSDNIINGSDGFFVSLLKMDT